MSKLKPYNWKSNLWSVLTAIGMGLWCYIWITGLFPMILHSGSMLVVLILGIVIAGSYFVFIKTKCFE